MIQQDVATLYHEYKSFKYLLAHFEKDIENKTQFALCAEESTKILMNYWDTVNMNVMIAAITFSFETIDPMFIGDTKINQVYEFIEEWGSTYLSTFNIITNSSKSVLKAHLKIQLSELLSKQNVFTQIDHVIREMKQNAMSTNSTYNAKLIWALIQLIMQSLYGEDI